MAKRFKKKGSVAWVGAELVGEQSVRVADVHRQENIKSGAEDEKFDELKEDYEFKEKENQDTEDVEKWSKVPRHKENEMLEEVIEDEENKLKSNARRNTMSEAQQSAGEEPKGAASSEEYGWRRFPEGVYKKESKEEKNNFVECEILKDKSVANDVNIDSREMTVKELYNWRNEKLRLLKEELLEDNWWGRGGLGGAEFDHWYKLKIMYRVLLSKDFDVNMEEMINRWENLEKVQKEEMQGNIEEYSDGCLFSEQFLMLVNGAKGINVTVKFGYVAWERNPEKYDPREQE